MAVIAVVALFLWYSGRLASELAAQERERMRLWAEATRLLAQDENDPTEVLDFLFGIIEANRSIPVILTDCHGDIIAYNNISDRDSVPQSRLETILRKMQHDGSSIAIPLAPDNVQHLYYRDSSMLRTLSYYPAVQMAVMLSFVIGVYLALSAARRSERDRLWVGLSKETAHQLGTPISSLMAWTDILREQGAPEESLAEMQRDIDRLSMISSRFSKIGSRPPLEPVDVNTIVAHSVDYLRGRISPQINIVEHLSEFSRPYMLSVELFEWVLEVLVKNGVDATSGRGTITIKTYQWDGRAIVEVSDTGRGIKPRDRERIFRPGYTTKRSGWGLGLALARRIIADYHRGRIYVSGGAPGAGSTFRIEIP